MKHRTLSLSLAAAAALLGGAHALQDGEGPGGGPPMAEPTEHHEVLRKMAGRWNATMEMPMAGISGSEATYECRMLGELWLIEDYEGEVMGAPFRGHGQVGYDSEKEAYVGTWVDNWNDGLTAFEGEYDPETRILRFEVPGRSMTGEPQTEIHETELVDDDHMVFRMKWPGPDGELVTAMTIHYERAE